MNVTGSTRNWTVLAHLLRPQGRKGEVLADLLTDFPERFTDRPEVHLGRPAPDGTHRDPKPATITGHWLPVGRNHGRVVLTFTGVVSIEAAEALAGLDVIIDSEARVELEEVADYISDLVDCEVYDRGTLVGRIVRVEFATSADGHRRLTDAAPLLVIDAGGEEVLIPYVQQFLLCAAVEDKRIDMQLPVGLIEINRRAHDAASGDTLTPEMARDEI